VRAAAGCYDAALAYRTPFISGKDSLNNEYRAADGSRTPIPPTLLISALAIVPDVLQAVTSDLKEAGNQVYLVGLSKNELLGAHAVLCGLTADDSALPQVDLASAPAILRAVHAAIAAGLVRACHDLSEGGLAVAAAEMVIAGNLGLAIDLRSLVSATGMDDAQRLFCESPTRFLLEVRSAHAAAFEAAMVGLPYAQIGEVTSTTDLVVIGTRGDPAISLPLAELKAAWQGTQVV
jgi:phosphoribosylformylglycinamidine synthase subunit PurSL